MKHRVSPTWQVTLADLSLILFLVALPGLLAGSSDANEQVDEFQLGTRQAIYRWQAEGPSLKEWLNEQVRDDRTGVTIVVEYRPGNDDRAFAVAKDLVEQARASGAPARVMIAIGEEDDAYASLGYDLQAASTRLRPERFAR